jgi:hypothetical protein
MIEGVRNATIVHDMTAPEAFPIAQRGLREAIERAVVAEDRARSSNDIGRRYSRRRRRLEWAAPCGSAAPSELASRARPLRADSAFVLIQGIGGSTG